MAEPHEAAKWRADNARDDAPVREPMTGKGTKPAQKRKPDTDQKKIRREMARSAADDWGRTHDICANCGEAIHDGAGIDPNVPWVHADTGNSRCEVSQPADAVMLRGVETDEAHPMYKNSYTPRDFLRTVVEDFERRQRERAEASSVTALMHAPEVTLSPGTQHADLGLHTRPVSDDSDFDSYLVSRCLDHGTKACGDRESQGHYIALAQDCHDDAHGPDANGHSRWHHSEGHSCWSCCPDMYVARPGERESGRVAMRQANIDRAGDRECEACGQVAAPVLGDTGPVCARCGSYSLKQAPHQQPARAAYAAQQPRQATRMDSNVATSDGRILINPGDQIKTPTGQALTVKNIRRHETSRDHYYLDTDAGTTLVPWTTNFTLVPNNQSQQYLPGTGIPGGNSNSLPSLENPVSNTGPNVCPACGGKGTMNRQGQTYRCTQCGYTNKGVGLEQNFSDATQQFVRASSRTAGAIAQRARAVLDQEEENPS